MRTVFLEQLQLLFSQLERWQRSQKWRSRLSTFAGHRHPHEWFCEMHTRPTPRAKRTLTNNTVNIRL